jgi:hypothetical protein
MRVELGFHCRVLACTVVPLWGGREILFTQERNLLGPRSSHLGRKTLGRCLS